MRQVKKAVSYETTHLVALQQHFVFCLMQVRQDLHALTEDVRLKDFCKSLFGETHMQQPWLIQGFLLMAADSRLFYYWNDMQQPANGNSWMRDLIIWREEHRSGSGLAHNSSASLGGLPEARASQVCSQ